MHAIDCFISEYEMRTGSIHHEKERILREMLSDLIGEVVSDEALEAMYKKSERTETERDVIANGFRYRRNLLIPEIAKRINDSFDEMPKAGTKATFKIKVAAAERTFSVDVTTAPVEQWVIKHGMEEGELLCDTISRYLMRGKVEKWSVDSMTIKEWKYWRKTHIHTARKNHE